MLAHQKRQLFSGASKDHKTGYALDGPNWKEIPAHIQQAKEKTEQSSADNPAPSGTSDAYASGMPDSGESDCRRSAKIYDRP